MACRDAPSSSRISREYFRIERYDHGRIIDAAIQAGTAQLHNRFSYITYKNTILEWSTGCTRALAVHMLRSLQFREKIDSFDKYFTIYKYLCYINVYKYLGWFSVRFSARYRRDQSRFFSPL